MLPPPWETFIITEGLWSSEALGALPSNVPPSTTQFDGPI